MTKSSVKPKMKPVASLAQKLAKVKLPTSTWWLNGSQIMFLTDLEPEPPSNRTCGCPGIVGYHVVRQGAISFRNSYVIQAKNCFDTLLKAQDALTLRNAIDVRKTWIDNNSGYRQTQSSQIRVLMLFPEIVLKHLREEFKIEDANPLTAKDMKTSHYRLALAEGGFSALFPKIVAAKFQELVDSGDDGIEDDE